MDPTLKQAMESPEAALEYAENQPVDLPVEDYSVLDDAQKAEAAESKALDVQSKREIGDFEFDLEYGGE